MCGTVAVLLFALGLILDALPEDGVGEWNGLPLGEYGLTNLWGGILAFGVLGAVCAIVALVRRRDLTAWQRRIAVGVVALGATALGLTILVVLFVLALCGSGACD